MTIDETIKHARNIAKQQRYYAQFEKGMMRGVCINTAENNEQIAEWLEELKAIRQWKSDIMEDFCRYDVNCFEELISNTRKKTIDEFAEMLKEKYEEHKFDLCLRQNDYYSYSNSCMLFESYIDDIAEQLKAGDSNGT